jgi:tetratricopeptide (TPR) repeat protein
MIGLASRGDRLLVAPENRAAFVAAVEALDGEHPQQALPALEAAAREAPASPVIQFHYHACLEEAGKAAGSDIRLDKVLQDPSARDALLAWGQTHPSLARHASQIVTKVMERAPGHDPDRKAAELDFARRLYELLLALDPKNFSACEGLAVIAERRDDFAAAQEFLDRFGDGGMTTETDEKRTRFIRHHQLCARISIKSAQAALNASETPASSRGAIQELERAVAELGRVESVTSVDDKQTHFEIDYMLCEARLAFGDLLLRQNKTDEARTHYAEAGSLLEKLTPTGKGLPWFQDLSVRVKKHLEPAAGPDPSSAEGDD